MTQETKFVALFESIVSGRLSRRQALQRASALGLGVAAVTALPGQFGAGAQGGGSSL